MLCPNKILGKVQVRMKDRFHFCRDYCACGLLGELGVSSACHFLKILVGFAFIPFEGHWGEQFEFTPPLVAFEVVSRAFSLG